MAGAGGWCVFQADSGQLFGKVLAEILDALGKEFCGNWATEFGKVWGWNRGERFRNADFGL